MLPQWRYQQARYEARIHVQVKVLRVEAGIPTPARVQVDAEVVRVFRGERALKLGDRVHFLVSVLSGDEEWDCIPVGGTLWTNYAALQRAAYLEVFLEGTPPACEITLWQQSILEAPTDKPSMVAYPPCTTQTKSWIQRAMRYLTQWFGGKESAGSSW